jgi:hypothetical protein
MTDTISLFLLASIALTLAAAAGISALKQGLATRFV